jgi:hypothetical protein
VTALNHLDGWDANPIRVPLTGAGYALTQRDFPHVVGYFPVLIDAELVAHRLNMGYHCYRSLGNVMRLIEWLGDTGNAYVRQDALESLKRYQRLP